VLQIGDTWGTIEESNGGPLVDSDNSPSLGEYLQQARKRAGLSQRHLAARTGMHHSYIARLENGEVRSRPKPGHLQRLADALSIDLADLLVFLGVRPTLPETRTYFRRAYGVNDDEASVIANLVEHYVEQLKKGERINEETD
jgi:transcriptional regulator with XRE-family HTH domain